MFNKARQTGPHFGLPCKAAPGNADHRCQVHNRSPFRVRCADRECGHKLRETTLVRWVAELVQGAVVSMETLTRRHIIWSRLSGSDTVSLLFGHGSIHTMHILIHAVYPGSHGPYLPGYTGLVHQSWRHGVTGWILRFGLWSRRRR